MFITVDSFSNHVWAIPLKNEESQTITNEFSKNLTKSERHPLKIESDRGAEFF